MKIIKIYPYLDGGSLLVETDKGNFYQDNALDSKRKGTWYVAPYERGKNEHEVTSPKLIEQLKTLAWHNMRRGNWYGDFEGNPDGRWVRYEDVENLLKEKDKQIQELLERVTVLEEEAAARYE